MSFTFEEFEMKLKNYIQPLAKEIEDCRKINNILRAGVDRLHEMQRRHAIESTAGVSVLSDTHTIHPISENGMTEEGVEDELAEDAESPVADAGQPVESEEAADTSGSEDAAFSFENELGNYGTKSTNSNDEDDEDIDAENAEIDATSHQMNERTNRLLKEGETIATKTYAELSNSSDAPLPKIGTFGGSRKKYPQKSKWSIMKLTRRKSRRRLTSTPPRYNTRRTYRRPSSATITPSSGRPTRSNSRTRTAP
jgi:hypothetical protein